MQRLQQKADQDWMQIAINHARHSGASNEVPIGAVLVKDNKLISAAGNNPIDSNDPTAHAEINVIRAGAQKLNNYRLIDTTLYVTLEPCIMCMGAIIQARIRRVVYGATDPKTGAINSRYQIGNDNLLNHSIDFTADILKKECSELLVDFFKKKRNCSEALHL